MGIHPVDISPTPTITVDLLLTPTLAESGATAIRAASTSQAFAPTVTAIRSATVSAVPAIATVGAYVPNVGSSPGSDFVFAVPAIASAAAQSPVVTGGASLSAVVAASSASAQIPVVIQPVNATVNAVVATGTGNAPAEIIKGEAVLTGGGPGTATTQAYVPVVTGASGSMAFNAVGAGASSVSSAASLSWSHTASGSSRAVIVAVAVGCTTAGAASTWTRSVTYGGVAMTSLGVQNSAASTDGFIELWGLLNPATGAQTVVASATKSGVTPQTLIGGSVSYTGVGSFGTAVLASATTISASVVVSSAVGKMAVAAFCCGFTISTPTQTQRYLNNVNGVSRAGNMIIQDAAGAASVTFTASAPSAESWGQIGIGLV